MVDDHFVGLFISFDGSHIVHSKSYHIAYNLYAANSNQKLFYRQFACVLSFNGFSLYVADRVTPRQRWYFCFFLWLIRSFRVCLLYLSTRFIHSDRRSLTSSGCQIFLCVRARWLVAFEVSINFMIWQYRRHVCDIVQNTNTIISNNFVIIKSKSCFLQLKSLTKCILRMI